MRIINLLSICAALIVGGCATAPTDPTTPASAARVGLIVELAAYDTITLYLPSHPAARPKFEAAIGNLTNLLAKPTISAADLRIALSVLPVGELKSTEARLIISNAQIIFEDLLAQQTPITTPVYVRVVAERVAAGLSRGLREVLP